MELNTPTKQTRVQFRVTAFEQAKIKYQAHKAKMSITDYLLDLVNKDGQS